MSSAAAAARSVAATIITKRITREVLEVYMLKAGKVVAGERVGVLGSAHSISARDVS
jgi:hypothetical protein